MNSCAEAYYAGNKDKHKKPGSSRRSFTKETRQTILSFGITDNPCEALYDNNKSPSVKKTKPLASGTLRFVNDVKIKKRLKTQYDESKIESTNLLNKLVQTHRSQPKFTFPSNTKRQFYNERHPVAVPSPDAYFKGGSFRASAKVAQTGSQT